MMIRSLCALIAVLCSASLHPMETPNHYDTLGIAKDASVTDIQSAYKQRRFENQGDTTKLHELSEAFETLQDTQKRVVYDRWLESNMQLSRAARNLPTSRSRLDSVDRAQQSEASLLEMFAKITQTDIHKEWEQFIVCCDAHSAEFDKLVPGDCCTLLRNCAVLLNANDIARENAAIIQQIKALTLKYQTETNNEVRAELMKQCRALAPQIDRNDNNLPLLRTLTLQKIRTSLEYLFYERIKALDTNNSETDAKVAHKIELIAPAIERLLPGYMGFKKMFLDIILKVEVIDSLNPQEGIVCITDTFLGLIKRGKQPHEWHEFIALCQLAQEKWGKQREFVYLQALAAIICGGPMQPMCNLLSEDIRFINIHINNHKRIIPKVKVLSKVKNWYGHISDKPLPGIKEITKYCRQFSVEEEHSSF